MKADHFSKDVVVQFGVPPNRIDLLSSISGVDFESAWRGRLEERLELADGTSTPVYIIGLAELLANKRAANRDKDRDDLAYLEEE